MLLDGQHKGQSAHQELLLQNPIGYHHSSQAGYRTKYNDRVSAFPISMLREIRRIDAATKRDLVSLLPHQFSSHSFTVRGLPGKLPLKLCACYCKDTVLKNNTVNSGYTGP